MMDCHQKSPIIQEEEDDEENDKLFQNKLISKRESKNNINSNDVKEQTQHHSDKIFHDKYHHTNSNVDPKEIKHADIINEKENDNNMKLNGKTYENGKIDSFDDV